MTTGRKARGRPALPAEQVKRHSVGIRTTRKLKDYLLRALRPVVIGCFSCLRYLYARITKVNDPARRASIIAISATKEWRRYGSGS